MQTAVYKISVNINIFYISAFLLIYLFVLLLLFSILKEKVASSLILRTHLI